MALLTIDELDEAIEALALGAASFRLPNGTEVERARLADLMKYRDKRKAQQSGDVDLVPQFVEFPQ